MKREFSIYLEDIVKAMEIAIQFVEEMSYKDFVQDQKTIFAMTRALGK
ncbi:MAG: hypothetical protein M1421_05000 [Candidatus Eremiobacteraeota bacterium]|nr:hypothetical protein [Candidatus Eremiobacteraeota bacterium]MCL5055842.1 hypothetical protein [Bacillota bacterium]